MRVLVLGASGFVGNQVCESLSEMGYEVFRGTRQPSGKPNDFTYPTSIHDSSFVEKTTKVFIDYRFSWIVHAANHFRKGVDVSDSAQMLEANLFFPAAILQAAVNASATGFINIASGWQTSTDTKSIAPNYVATKESFRHFLRSNSNRLTTRTIFVNEVFGPGDNRAKLINLAIDGLKEGREIDLQSPDASLSLVYGPRLGREIGTVMGEPNYHPAEYLFENYSGLTVREIFVIIQNIIAGSSTEAGTTGTTLHLGKRGYPIRGKLPYAELLKDLRKTAGLN